MRSRSGISTYLVNQSIVTTALQAALRSTPSPSRGLHPTTESQRETAPGKHSRQHPHDEISEELNHASTQSQTQEFRQNKPIGTPIPHASAEDFPNDFPSDSTHDTNDRRSIRLEPIIHGILDTPPLTSVRPRKESRHYSTTTSPLFHHYAWNPAHKKMEFLQLKPRQAAAWGRARSASRLMESARSRHSRGRARAEAIVFRAGDSRAVEHLSESGHRRSNSWGFRAGTGCGGGALMIVPVSTSILAHRLQAARQRLETHIFKIEHPLQGPHRD